jgi:cell wall-associated NlpC family hydrolase
MRADTGLGHGPIWRGAGWGLATCAVLAAAAAGVVNHPGVARASNPPPGAVSAAAGQVKSRAAELNMARVQLADASARLASLRDQAEVIIERYDKTMVNLHQAAVAYRAAEHRLARATEAERASRRAVGALAAQDYEAGGGAGSMAAMLGNPGGPQDFLNGVAAEQQLARQGVDVLAQNRAGRVVAGVFRGQARRALASEQAAARQAAALKATIQATIHRQQAAVASLQASTKRLGAELGAARAHEFALEQAREQAEQSRRQALATQVSQASQPVTSTGASSGSWASGYSLAQGASAGQGDIAANWAISQIGKPYQWGGAGPDTYDCSGLTMDAWARAGVTLLHWTGYQWPSGPHIPISQLRRGDLLFFATDTADPATIHHVGIYIGNGEMVDAPYTGVDVRIDSIYQPGGLIGATRPAG